MVATINKAKKSTMIISTHKDKFQPRFLMMLEMAWDKWREEIDQQRNIRNKLRISEIKI
jgi:hypothetical protein